ncbi:hypothetical protein TELCIR_09582, partial [Teladorsagia circumcincta]
TLAVIEDAEKVLVPEYALVKWAGWINNEFPVEMFVTNYAMHIVKNLHESRKENNKGDWPKRKAIESPEYGVMTTEKKYATVPIEDAKDEPVIGAAPRVSCHGSNVTIEDVCKSHLDPAKLTDCDLEIKYEFKSLNVEFGYLCAEGRWVKSSISVQMVGVLIGTLFFGTMSDRYGRKSNLWRLQNGAYSKKASILGGYRNCMGAKFHSPQRFVHESPRWLIQKGKIKEARHVLQRIQHIDRQRESKKEEMEKMLDIAYQQIQLREKKMKNYNVRHLFYNKEMALATVVFCSGVFMSSMINYGLIFNIETLSGSFFVNSILMGLIRWSINIAFGVLDFKWKACGRKAVHLVSQASIAVALGAIAVTYIMNLEVKYSIIIRVATIFAAATTSQIFITKTISAMEYYPTVVRNSGLAFKSTCSRLGTILAPQLLLLNFWESLPYIVLTVMAALDTVMYQVVIPETKGKPLPENLPPKRENNRANLPGATSAVKV